VVFALGGGRGRPEHLLAFVSSFESSTPKTVGAHYGLTQEQTEDFSRRCLISFLDGTKSALEMGGCGERS